MHIIPFLMQTLLVSDIAPPSIHHTPADHEPDKRLTDWLKEQGADPSTIEKVLDVLKSVELLHFYRSTLIKGALLQFVVEEYTLTDILNDVSKDDLRCLHLR